MAFALASAGRNLPTDPPGRLPCPDTTGDGRSDPAPTSTAACLNSRRGLVPFLTLGIPQPLDGTGAPIWYVVSLQYTGVAASVTPYNSSSAASLLMLSGNRMAFILLAPNKPLAAQARTSLLPPFNAVSQFLEGDNADLATPDSYTDTRDDSDYDTVPDTQNDQVLGMPMGAFWTSVERKVLREVSDKLNSYFTTCTSSLPSAVMPFGAVGDVGSSPNFRGGLPFNLAALCSPGIPASFPQWLTTHWTRMLYYESCPAATPNCIDLLDINNAHIQFASAIVMAPGVPLSTTIPTQIPRAIGSIPQYFELGNVVVDNSYTQVKPSGHTPTFNDSIYVIR
jgi:hypothetical protein